MKPPKNQLEYWYTTQRKSTRQIADLCDVSHMSIKRWLREYGIPRREKGRGLANREIEPPTRDDLYRMVHFEHLSYREIAEMFKVDGSAVAHWLNKHGIEKPKTWVTRRKGVGPSMPTETELRSLYERGASFAAIGRLYGVSDGPIRVLSQRYGIVARPDGWQGKRFACTDGHMVRSTYEQRVDDWLSAHGLAHEYEPSLPFDGRYHADFLVNGWYVEIWGVLNNPAYATRKAAKLRLYRKHGLPLIHMANDAFSIRRNNWDSRLSKCLTPISVLQNAPTQLLLPDS